MCVLQLQLGEGAHQPQRHRTLLWRERQAAALLRHVEERLWNCGGRQARLLAGRCQLLRQVHGWQEKIQALGKEIPEKEDLNLTKTKSGCQQVFF